MTISFSVSRYDDRLDIYNWIAGNAGEDEISLSNANGVDVLLAIGLEPEPAGIVPLSAFAGLITAALRRHLGRRSPAIEPTSDGAPGRLTLIECGRREGYIEAQLGRLARLSQTGVVLGATHISWG